MPGERHFTPMLRMIKGPTPGRAFALNGQSTTLGRSKECEIVLVAETVSKRHAEIRRDGGFFLVEDLKSRNRTLVNGGPIKGPTRLQDGDHLTICEFTFAFQNPTVTIRDDDEGSSTILGSIEVKDANSHVPKVRPEDTLKAILEISRDIGHSLQLREVLERTLGSLFKIFPQADRGFVLLKDSEERGLTPQAIRFRNDEGGPLSLSTTVFAHVMNEGKAILSTNVPDDSRFDKSPSLHGAEIRTMMCAPMMDMARQPIGIIQIDTRDMLSRFSEENLDLLAAIAGPVGLAVENARLHDELIRLTVIEASLQNAHEVQRALLPDSRPDLPGYRFWDAYEPAQAVGGDYFDYLALGGEGAEPSSWAVSIGDVVGKGMPAALLMAKLSAEVRTCLLTEHDPVSAMERLNRQLYDDRFPERLITFLLVKLDAEAHRITVVNAGHMNPLIRRASGKIESLGGDEGGPPLAVLEDTPYRAVETTLEVGDVVVLYTDGVTEAMDVRDHCFREEGLEKTMAAAPLGAEAVGEAILQAVRRHASGTLQSDDIGLVCFGRV